MRRAGGFTLLEVMIVLVVVGIAAGIAAPKMNAYLARHRVRAALNRLAVDLAYARAVAVRSGSGAVLRFHPEPECGARATAAYSITLRGAHPGPPRRSSVRDVGGRVCLLYNGPDSVAFNSRGLLLPFQNRTVWSTEAGLRDSLTISVMGRVYRRF
ncbi:MAG TPA: prepilin-type N-terminal cleavage/methylation domain-containing protein [Longimicrobium sp.]|nr:prepilin-type N-terminal cleavage/methylation domain-containing protein [Longimicrobium sp.]